KDTMNLDESKYWRTLFENYKEELKNYPLHGFSLQGD
ncbi:MAG: hypothetical protein PWQ12_1769, partial [Clostridiales bacterium]|nr:hypothetical protein [Clostridiales bacterium]